MALRNPASSTPSILWSVQSIKLSIKRASTPFWTRSSCRTFSSSGVSRRGDAEVDFTHAVIGAGVVGLAVARRLAAREGGSTVLIEKNGAVGMETSSRNSEVIHAGLYYGKDNLKARLCIQGKEMMYEFCEKREIPHQRLGKWIVAQTDEQMEDLIKLHDHAKSLNIPISFIPLSKASTVEPSIRARTAVLESPTTGIIDSHSFMQALLADYTSSGGDVALNTSVTAITPISSGYEITTKDASTDESMTFTVANIVNCAGLSACYISNLLLPPERHVTPLFAKGNYFTFVPCSSGPKSFQKPKRLIYPAPQRGLGGLGTHLTLDISGAMRFGPDVEWVSSASDVGVSTHKLEEAVKEIEKYFPEVRNGELVPDYAGIRPKVGRVTGGKGSGESEGVVSRDAESDFLIRKEEGVGGGFVNCLGIESPGLTASLAIGELVESLVYD